MVRVAATASTRVRGAVMVLPTTTSVAPDDATALAFIAGKVVNAPSVAVGSGAVVVVVVAATVVVAAIVVVAAVVDGTNVVATAGVAEVPPEVVVATALVDVAAGGDVVADLLELLHATTTHTAITAAPTRLIGEPPTASGVGARAVDST